MLSVIIPTLNAGATLEDCLRRIKAADEIVIVDGGSTDDSAAIAKAAEARVIVAPRGRGAQLHAGAEAATGDWLLFLHADTMLGPVWRRAVDSHISISPAKAACFRFRLSHDGWQARALELGVAARVALFGLPYGDQGLLISRSLYQRLGGYRPLPLMEDVDLVRRIGRRRLMRMDGDASTSADRWLSDGWLRRSGRNLLCLTLYSFGVSTDRIARLYG